jgi:hypothetical protein
VVWEDDEGKEVLVAYLGQTCGPGEVDEQPLLWKEEQHANERVIINEKPTQTY